MLKMLQNVGCPKKKLDGFAYDNRLVSLGKNQFSRINQLKRPYSVDTKPKRFEFPNSFDNQNRRRQDNGEKSIAWNIYPWLAMGIGIVAYLLVNKDSSAEEDSKPVDLVDPVETKVTKKNFEEIIDKLKKDSSLIHTLEFEFVLWEKEVNELSEAIKDHVELGYVRWHQDQIIYKGIKNIENKLIENNKNYRSYPNDYVHGLLAKHAYKNSQEGGLVSLNSNVDTFLKNWQVAKVFDDTKKSGYYSAIYVNEKTHQVVLANRGTEGIIDGLYKVDKDWQVNFEEILGGKIIVGQQARNLQATAEAIKIAKEKGYRLSFTGHSLGAWLAELSAFYSYAYFNYRNIKAVTFDSPGSAPMMDKLQSNIRNKDAQVKLESIDIVTYLAQPNPANSCNGHVGTVYRVEPKMELTTSAESRMPNVVRNAYGDKIKAVLSVEGHFLDGILETFDPGTGKPKTYKKMLDWPKVKYEGTQSFFTQGKEAIKEVSANSKNMPAGIQTALNLALDHVIEDSTLMTIVGFLKTYIKGGIDAEQYWAYFSLIDIEKEGEGGSKVMDFDQRFKVITLAKYREGEDMHLMKLTIGSVDEYLFRLNERRNKLNENNILPIIKEQLEDILSSFEIKSLSNDGKTYALVAKNKGEEEAVRERMQRLLMVVPKQERDLSRINTPKTILTVNTSADVEVQYERVSKLPDNLPLEAPFYVEIRNKKAELEKKLETEQVVVLSGIGGMGKSTLATKYGRDRKQRSEQVIWFEENRIEENFLKLAKFMKIGTQNLSSEELRDLVYAGFERYSPNRPILLIFDSVDKEEKIVGYLKSLPNNVKVIITSRNDSLLTTTHTTQHIKIEGFTQKDALEYLSKAFENNERGVNAKEIKKLQNRVGTLPFELAAAVGYLKTHTLISITDYIDKYARITKDQPAAILLLRDLTNPESRELLNYLAYLDIGGVGVQLMGKILGKTIGELEKYVEELKQSSLISVINDENGGRLLKVSHKIVEEETQKALSTQHPEQIPIISKRLMQEFDKEFPDIENNPQKLEGAIKLVNHVRLLVEYEENSPEKESLLAKIGYYDSEIVFNYKDAIYYFEALLHYRRSIYPNNHPEIAKVLDNLGSAYKKLGGDEHINKGLKYQKELLKIRKEIFKYFKTIYGDNHAETAKALDNLGNAHLALGDKDHVRKALEHLNKSLKIKQSLYFGNHADIASSLHIVGKAYQALGGKDDILKGLEYEERSLQMSKDLSTKNDREMALLYDNIGLGYQNLGENQNIRKGIKFQEEALAIKQKLSLPGVASSFKRIGMAYAELREKEDLSKGIDYLQSSLEIREELFPGNHADIADLLSTIGILHGILSGNHHDKKSLEYLKKSLSMWQELDKSSPNDREILLRMAMTLNNTGKASQKLSSPYELKEGLNYLINSLNTRKRIFETNHPDIAKSLDDVGIAYLALGGEDNYRLGHNYIEQGLKMRQELFLGNHADIGQSMDSMAKAYEKLEDNDKALEYRKQAMSIYNSLDNTKKQGKHSSEHDWASLKAQSIREINEHPDELAKLILAIEGTQPKFFAGSGKEKGRVLEVVWEVTR